MLLIFSAMRCGIAIVALALTVTGCTKKSQEPAAAPTVGSVVSETPSAATTPSPKPAMCPGEVKGGNAPSQDALKAWLCQDNAGLQKHLNDAARDQMKAVPRDIDLQWTFVSCGGAAGSTYCTYRNALGSDLIFRILSQTPDRVVEVKFDRTLFPNNAEQYTRHFLAAWLADNTPRMRALSSASVTSFATSHSKPAAGYTVTLSPSEVWIFEVESSGADYRFVLQGQLGRANAITELNSL